MTLRRLLLPLLLLALAASVPVAGCEAITGPSELERKIAAEQKVIEAYSTEVAKVDGLQRAFVDAWQAAHELKDVKAYKEALTTRVLPALDAYVAAVDGMPTGSEELAAIHVILVDAYKQAQTAFKAFADQLTADTVETGYKEVLAKMDEVKVAEGQYLDKLKTYYAKNRVDLMKPGAAPAPAATEP